METHELKEEKSQGEVPCEIVKNGAGLYNENAILVIGKTKDKWYVHQVSEIQCHKFYLWFSLVFWEQAYMYNYNPETFAYIYKKLYFLKKYGKSYVNDMSKKSMIFFSFFCVLFEKLRNSRLWEEDAPNWEKNSLPRTTPIFTIYERILSILVTEFFAREEQSKTIWTLWIE